LSKGKPGKFELAHHGTVFLDEIGDLPLDMQPKLLRVLEEKEFERVGGNSVIPVDFRLIAATNQNLEQMVDDRRFRRDLFYRLNVIPLRVPALRERKEDIIPLAHHVLDQILGDAPGLYIKIDSRTENMLLNHDWQGNVRELSNVLERIVSSLDGDTIEPRHLPFPLSSFPKATSTQKNLNLHEALFRAEEDALRSALALSKNNKARAARLLGIHRTQLYKKMRKHHLPQE
jgi:transcriptional regulator with PAS, ATPase and Fis domain